MRSWKSESFEVSLTGDGFKFVSSGRLVHAVCWEDVRGVGAFNRDLFTGSAVCLAFNLGAKDYVVVSETIPGYSELLGAVVHHFSDSYNAAWGAALRRNPLETSWTVIAGEAPEPVACRRCGYDLRGATGGCCPECGTDRFVCPGCNGRGHFRSALGLWMGGGLAVGGVLGTLLGPVTSPWTLGCTATVVVGLLLLRIGMSDMAGHTCRLCGGTGRRQPGTSG